MYITHLMPYLYTNITENLKSNLKAGKRACCVRLITNRVSHDSIISDNHNNSPNNCSVTGVW